MSRLVEYGLVAVVTLGIGFAIGQKSNSDESIADDLPILDSPEESLLVDQSPKLTVSDEVANAMFDRNHAHAEAAFVAVPAPIFSYSRMGHGGYAPEQIPMDDGKKAHEFDFFTDPVFSRHDFTFIGNDPVKRKHQDGLEEFAGEPFVVSFRYKATIADGNIPVASGAPLSVGNWNSPSKNIVMNGNIQIPPMTPKWSKPTKVDLAAIEYFESNTAARRKFHTESAGRILGYGPIRARAACANCHGVDEGTVLGLFRYRFEDDEALIKVLALE